VTEKSEVQDRVFEKLVWHRWLVIRINSGMRGNISFYLWQILGYVMERAGVADLIGCTPEGRFFAFETKRPGKEATAIQLRFLNAVRERGGIAEKIDDPAQVDKYLTENIG